MIYISTRNSSKEFNFSEVFIKGLADDGGLFIPKTKPKLSNEELLRFSKLSYQDLAKDYTAIETPTWALLLAQSVRSVGYKTEIFDVNALRLSTNDAVKEIKNYKTRLLCFVVYGQNPNSGTVNMSGAIKLAKKSEEKFSANKKTLPLEGIPVAIKDEEDITGQPNSNGSLILKDHIASKTMVDVERIIESGAITHCRTTTPEFSCTSFTHSKLWGVTRNPWNLDFTPGGSSGGSGASLAAGCSTLATGSDIGGSIRIPASACGLVGFKPPYGRNPQAAPFNHDQYCVVGPMARNVEDCVLMQNVMSGPHKKDITSIKPKLLIPNKFENIKNWKIAYSIDLGYFEVDKDCLLYTSDAADE
mgnify:CR=1 FL=1